MLLDIYEFGKNVIVEDSDYFVYTKKILMVFISSLKFIGKQIVINWLSITSL